MTSKNFRGRSMLDMVLGKSHYLTELPSASNIEAFLVKEKPVIEKKFELNICNLDNLFSYPLSYDNYKHILTPEVEFASTLALSDTDLQMLIDLLNTTFETNKKDNESFNLLCDETFPSSLMDLTFTNLTLELEEPVNDIASIENRQLPEDSLNYDMIDIASSSKNSKNREPQRNNLNHNTLETESSSQNAIHIESENDNIDHAIDLPRNTTKGKTKSGKPRIRRKFKESVETRLEEKKKLKLEKMAVKPGCNESCIKKCMSSFTELERKRVNEIFWKFSYEAQGLYVKSLVTEKDVFRRIQDSQQMRKHTYVYFLEIENKKKEVCKTFFLTTLGYRKNNDRRVLDILKKLPESQADRRGKHESSKKLDREKLKQHIESFRPAIAHYRRAHAPNRRYLPSDLNATMMHTDFTEKNPNFKVSYALYRKFLKKDMNISFAQLGNEECEQCERFKLHQISCKDTENCTDCIIYRNHREKDQKARIYYQQDVAQSLNESESSTLPSKCYYSADLQKVIMLPRLDMFKVVMFCPRIIAFNESFVPLGSNKKEKPFAAVWHEAISGRKQEDIISTYKAFFESKRDYNEIIVWTDNCTSQNKNWAFFTFLIQIINSHVISATKIIIKYFEPGHTFMSADNFHHQVEKQLQKAKKVYDFSDFIDCVQLANSGKVNVKPMEISDFYKYKDHSSQYKLKKCEERTYLKDIVCVEVQRNSMKLYVKTAHDGDMIEIDFLKSKLMKQSSIPEPVRNQKPRGITQERKTGILKKLGDIIPENRLTFWQNLPVNDDSVDLIEVREPGE